MYPILLSVTAGLILFLYAIASLSKVLHQAVEEKAKKWLLKMTSNIFWSILSGTFITILLDSSSAVIIITIIFVNAKLLTFRQSMGIVLGANIGTTISSQIIALDISKFSPILLLIGFFISFFSGHEKIKKASQALFYFGLLFFGLYTIEEAVEPLKTHPEIFEYMKKTEQPLWGAFIGMMVTLVIQSSSATVGMSIVMAKKGLLSLTGGIAIMIGSELGTCSDTLLATINGSKQAIKTGIFHLIFNLLSIIMGLIFFYPFVSFIEWISKGQQLEKAVANAHVFFNLIGVLLFVWFIPWFQKILDNIFPDKSQDF